MKGTVCITISLLLKLSLVSGNVHEYTVDLDEFADDTEDDYDDGYGPKFEGDEEVKYMEGLVDAPIQERKNCPTCVNRCSGTTTITLGEDDSTVLCSNTYAKNYKKNENCKVDISAPSSTWLKVTFCEFYVHYSKACNKDKLVVLDRGLNTAGAIAPCESKYQKIRRFCGLNSGKVYYIKTPYVRFKFTTNGDTKVMKGFNMKIETITSPCYFKLNKPSGTIRATHMSGGKYHANYYCRWEYEYAVNSGEAFHLVCPTFELHKGIVSAKISPDCMHLTGANKTEYSFTDTKGPTYISLGGNVTLEFFTNKLLHRKGFQCEYTVNAAGALGGLCKHADNCNDDRLTCISEICECDTSAGYGQVTHNGEEVCAKGVDIGVACTNTYDCVALDSNSYCSSTCKCNSDYVDVGSGVAASRCQPKRNLNQNCVSSVQCVNSPNNGLMQCSGGKCVCKSGYGTTNCGGGKYSGRCLPKLEVPKGSKGKLFSLGSIPGSYATGSFKFCVHNFQANGNILFKFGNNKQLKFTWVGSNKLTVWKKVGNKGSTVQKNKIFSIKPNPDYFWYKRIGGNSAFAKGTGPGITYIGKMYAPNKWAQVFLYSTWSAGTKTIVFVGKS